jgi:hypothetical protein
MMKQASVAAEGENENVPYMSESLLPPAVADMFTQHEGAVDVYIEWWVVRERRRN